MLRCSIERRLPPAAEAAAWAGSAGQTARRFRGGRLGPVQ